MVDGSVLYHDCRTLHYIRNPKIVFFYVFSQQNTIFIEKNLDTHPSP